MADVEIAVGKIVTFTFDTPGRSSSVRHTNYAIGEITKVGKRVSIRITDGHHKHSYWREKHIGTTKVVDLRRIIPPMEE